MEIRLGYLSNIDPYIQFSVARALGLFSSDQLPARLGVSADEMADEISKRLEMFMPLVDEANALAKQI